MPPLRRYKILNKADILLLLRWVINSIESLRLLKPKRHRDATHMKKAKKKTKRAMKAMKLKKHRFGNSNGEASAIKWRRLLKPKARPKAKSTKVGVSSRAQILNTTMSLSNLCV